MIPNTLIKALTSSRTVALSAIVLTLAVFNTAAAAGNAAAGKDKSVTCAACHGADGNSANPTWPNLAGQNEAYIIATLQAFNSGERTDPVMGAQSISLTEEDMADLAAYYSALTPKRRTANLEFAELGQSIYRGGIKETSVSACIACHGPTGAGIEPAAYPALAGQHAPYTAKQLNDYQSGNRTSDGDAQIMRNITARLTQQEIKAVAAYIQGLTNAN